MKAWNRTLIAVVGLVALANVVAACGDDDKKTPTDTTQPTDTLTQDTLVEDTLVADSNEADTTADTTPAVTDQCTNAEDLARITDDTKADPADIAAKCALGTCIGSLSDPDALETCTSDCMRDGTSDLGADGLTADCRGCYAASVRCTAEKCLGECAGGADAPGCVSCRETKGCTPEFFTCSGLTPPT